MSETTEEFDKIIDFNWSGKAPAEAGQRGLLPVFIPDRLVIGDNPELAAFPAQIEFGSFEVDEDGHNRVSTYVPNIDSYKSKPLAMKMRYINQHGEEKADWIDFYVWTDESGQVYEAQKYVQGKPSSHAFGHDWEVFFSDLTGQGIIEGEKFDVRKPIAPNSEGVH